MKVLVTGGAGYIGSKICLDLITAGHRLTIIDNLSTGYKKFVNKKSNFYLCDLSNSKKVKNIIIKNEIEAVIHCAASIKVEESEAKPKKYFINNVLNTEKLLKSLSGSKVKYFVFSSTCAVYGNVKSMVSEKTKLNPISVYGKTKFMGENLIKKYSKIFNFNFIILRYFNVAGSDIKNNIGILNKNNQLIKNLSIAIKRKKYFINIFGKGYQTKDGTCVRDYIHLKDISKIHLLSLKYLKEKKRSDIFNCGYGKGHSVKEIVKFFENSHHIKFKINFSKKRKGDIGKIYSNNKKLLKNLRFKIPKNPMNDIVRSSINWELKIK